MSDSEGATPSPSPPPSVPTSSRSKRSAFAPPAKRNSQMALPIQPPVPTFIPNPQPITPNVASVASALFAMTTPPQGDGSPANSRERWQMCIYAVINKSVMLNQQTTQQSMILKDLETADKVMKKEPEETPPPSVDASPLQVMRPPPPQVPNNNSGGPPAPPVVPAATPNRIVPSSTASPYGSPLGASLLSNQPLVLPFAPINGDFDFNAAIAAVSQPKPVFPGGPPQNGLGGGGGVPGPSSGIVGMSVQPPVSTPSQIQQQSGVEGTSGLIGNAMKPMLGIEAVSFPEFSEFGTTDWQSPMLSGGYSSSPSPTMTGGSGSMRMGGGPMHGGEDESNRKRQVRLLKNREAAKECRRKKKEYVKCLENRVSVLENQNKALIEELKTLKELYCRKEKDGM